MMKAVVAAAVPLTDDLGVVQTLAWALRCAL